MSCTNEKLSTEKIDDLRVRGYDNTEVIHLRPAYVSMEIPMDRQHIPTKETAASWSHLNHLVDKMPPLLNADVGLLIGYESSELLCPLEVIPPTRSGEPYAQRTPLGWAIVGGDNRQYDTAVCHRITTATNGAFITNRHISTKEVMTSEAHSPYDYITPTLDELKDHPRHSMNDVNFIRQLEDGIQVKENGHYEMPLPFKVPSPDMPDNKSVAVKRFEGLKRRFQRDEIYKQEYTRFMTDIINKGFAEKCEDSPSHGKVWYIPHHGVYHPKKRKLRVVFDASARHQNVSLNDLLLQGPDLTNALLGVLCRFRRERVAVCCDVEQMFYQFYVDPKHRDFLRFLWYDGDLNKPPAEYRMTVHLFGASSSPGCANFGLKRAADEGEDKFGSDAANFIRNNFYVDDGLVSVATEDEAIALVDQTKQICKARGINVCKFVSNSEKVIQNIPIEERAKGMQDLEILRGGDPVERTLGLEWSIKQDSFKFSINLKDRPTTRRGLLSAVSSLFDPLGLLCPVIVVGKQILQDICKLKLDWDEALPQPIIDRWISWKNSLFQLESLRIPRCYQPENFGTLTDVQLHHFSDASQLGLGQCSYLRLKDDQGIVHCSLVMGKARVCPLKVINIPRLELSAAALSVKLARFLSRELDYNSVIEHFWTDSEVALGYINNDAKRFHVYVSNRVQQIRNYASTDQWHYVSTKENPADYASRGISAAQLQTSMWFTGPKFLWERDVFLEEEIPEVSEDDPEVKKCLAVVTHEQFDLDSRMTSFSKWSQAKRAIAFCLRFINSRKNSAKNDTSNVEMLQKAENEIVKSVQRAAFPDSIRVLSGSKIRSLKKRNVLFKLDPFLDEDGILRVGGRLGSSRLPGDEKHPAILPKNAHISKLIIQECHEAVNHQGRGMTVNRIRAMGYWILGCTSAVRSLIWKCVKCRKFRGTLETQKMSDLPDDRTEPAAPFSYCAVDLFGPFLVKEGRKELKRYGVLFTCLSSRAVHIETANSLSTDSFINSLRRMIAIRGPIRQLRSDQGTNFVGAKLEFQKEFEKLDQAQVSRFLENKGCDYFPFNMNVPSAPPVRLSVRLRHL